MMMLARDTVTAAARVMLPTYPVLFGYLGFVYMVTEEGRLVATPALEFAGEVMPLPMWGLMFLVAAALLAVALLRHDRSMARFALWLGLVCMSVWSLMHAAAAIWSTASPSAWAWPAFVAAACFASHRSLRRQETGRDCG